jgi:hypothetical protein
MIFTNLKNARNFMAVWLKCIEITDEDRMLLVYWTVRGLHEQQIKNFVQIEKIEILARIAITIRYSPNKITA